MKRSRAGRNDVVRPSAVRSKISQRIERESRFPAARVETDRDDGLCIGRRGHHLRAEFAAIYIGAVEDCGRFLGPVHVYRMTHEQAALADNIDRENYATAVIRRNGISAGTRWYADNTREPIRDETLRDGLVAIGAVIRREDLPTTSSEPRYALKRDFATLFDPALDGAALETAIATFQETHLSNGALARVTIMREGAAANVAGIRVTFPNGETRLLAPGPSSIITQAVIEVFAKRFLSSGALVE
ncbi:BsuBI/PstI family type II restriction endonuclease [Nordella sp. HKS 07]|uniref:BsuBI/PstI family type II restriction endonuclease n=1 Tax=Nordella sp. HKS 07 TaxID=2712222 RepID=UPI001FEDA82F|nr:BsuBI/PstI family type II restriction endonuclease [Nordella sp. HKS 07]